MNNAFIVLPNEAALKVCVRERKQTGAKSSDTCSPQAKVVCVLESSQVGSELTRSLIKLARELKLSSQGKLLTEQQQQKQLEQHEACDKRAKSSLACTSTCRPVWPLHS